MNFFSASLVNLLCFLFIHHLIITIAFSANLPNPYYFIGDVAINCGSTGKSTTLDGREWIGDTGSKHMYFLQPKRKSTSTAVVHKSYADPVTSMKARISSAQFLYTLPVNPGQIFICLHFYPALYRGFENSYDFFSVKAGPFTLLSNFSASLAAGSLGIKYIIKEYCLNVEEDQALTIEFSPSKPGKSEKTYAFINGIEITSMPTGLYYTLEGDLGANIVGQKNRFYYVDNKTALEMVQRLNIGGSSISSAEDSGLYRRWSDDANYLMETDVYAVNYGTRMIKYPSMLIYVAPREIYQTSWSTNLNKLTNKKYNLTWKIPVDVGFGYLIRLHFCELEPRITDSGQRVFSISINNQMAETNADVIQWSGGNGIPVHRDYTVILKGDRERGKCILSISVQSKIELLDGLLNGIEIMKLSNPDNNLARPCPKLSPQASTCWRSKVLKLLLVSVSKNGIATSLTVVMILINIAAYNLRKFWEAKLPDTHFSLVKKVNGGEDKYKTSTSTEQLSRRFSFSEIQSATQNFNDGFVVGKGGFGKVYKGYIDNGAKLVAIKRLTSNSKQGAEEFWMEIETLSKLRHVHLVSLIGYCDESQEMILVYEYMPRGSLADHLYGINRSRNDYSPITWEQRLRICIGAARGLDYLHTGTVPGVIHRDVKDSNILLDEKFVAKVSDFGLAKLEKSNSYVTTKVKGTFGYLDPDYFFTHKLSKKSDVYAFGVVLLVVLCGRPAVDRKLTEDQQGLAFWAQEGIREGEVDQIIDTTLRGKLSSESLNEFVGIAKKCLHKQPRERPTMTQVVASLESALQQEQQQNAPSISQDVETVGHLPNLEAIQSLDDISEEMTDVGGPWIGGSFDSITIAKRRIQKKEQYNEADLQRRKKHYTSNYKPARLWPWKMLWTTAKPSKNEDLVLPDAPFLRFSITEIRAATGNFSPDRIICHDALSRLYEGFLEQMKTRVSIKRFLYEIKMKNEREFCSEIERVSQLQHPNLVSLIGYCYNHNPQENILVYEYMPQGSTLADRLYGFTRTSNGSTLADRPYGFRRSSNDDFSLTWEQRLRICIGTARGIDYLHISTKPGVIYHGVVRDSNILLDEKLVAKVSDFGGAYLKLSLLTRMSTDVDAFGYLDPAFISTYKQSEKSDVYAFGVVLLVVLCGRSVYDERLVMVGKNLVTWALEHIRGGEVDQIIDATLRGQISSDSLDEFVQIGKTCLHTQPEDRPTMAEVVASLEFALQQQSVSSTSQDLLAMSPKLAWRCKC